MFETFTSYNTAMCALRIYMWFNLSAHELQLWKLFTDWKSTTNWTTAKENWMVFHVAHVNTERGKISWEGKYTVPYNLESYRNETNLYWELFSLTHSLAHNTFVFPIWIIFPLGARSTLSISFRLIHRNYRFIEKIKSPNDIQQQQKKMVKNHF